MAVGLALFQEGQCKIDLLRRELLRSAVLEARVLSGNRLSCFENEGRVVKYPLCREEQILWGAFQQEFVMYARFDNPWSNIIDEFWNIFLIIYAKKLLVQLIEFSDILII